MRSAALPFPTRPPLVAWPLGESWACVRVVGVGCDQRPCRAIDRARPMPWAALSPLAVLTVRLLLPAPSHEPPWFPPMRRPMRGGVSLLCGGLGSIYQSSRHTEPSPYRLANFTRRALLYHAHHITAAFAPWHCSAQNYSNLLHYCYTNFTPPDDHSFYTTFTLPKSSVNSYIYIHFTHFQNHQISNVSNVSIELNSF